MTTAEVNFKKAKQAVDDLFGDKSVSREQTKEYLSEIFADIEGMLDTLDDEEEDESEEG